MSKKSRRMKASDFQKELIKASSLLWARWVLKCRELSLTMSSWAEDATSVCPSCLIFDQPTDFDK